MAVTDALQALSETSSCGGRLTVGRFRQPPVVSRTSWDERAEQKGITMIKTCFCAAAMLIGALVGLNAPAEWRGDAARITVVTDLQAVSIALADRPTQR
jgi:hypothetical protein